MCLVGPPTSTLPTPSRVCVFLCVCSLLLISCNIIDFVYSTYLMCLILYYNAIFAAYALQRLSYIQYIFWLPKVQALIKKTTICISSFILNSVSFVIQVCSIEFSFSELIEFCSIFEDGKECRWVHKPVYCFAYSVHNPGDIVYNTWDKDLCCNKPTTSRALCLDWKINKSTFFFFLVLIEIYWTKTSTIVIR